MKWKTQQRSSQEADPGKAGVLMKDTDKLSPSGYAHVLKLHTFHLEYDGKRGEHDPEVKHQTPVSDVEQIILQFDQRIFSSSCVVMSDLRPAGKSRFYQIAKPEEWDGMRQFINKHLTFRSGAYQVHITFQDIHELG